MSFAVYFDREKGNYACKPAKDLSVDELMNCKGYYKNLKEAKTILKSLCLQTTNTKRK